MANPIVFRQKLPRCQKTIVMHLWKTRYGVTEHVTMK